MASGTKKEEESEETPLLQQQESNGGSSLSQKQQQQQQPQQQQHAQNVDPNTMAAYAMMAAQYEHAGYYPADAAAAAASLAAYQQQQQQQQQNMYYGQSGTGGFPFPSQAFYPQPNQPQFNMQTPPKTRPPRSSRRQLGSSPKSTREKPNTNIFGFPWGTTSATTATTTTTGNHPLTDEGKKTSPDEVEIPIPPLQDVFSTDQSLGNYGAIPSQDPKIWTAPTGVPLFQQQQQQQQQPRYTLSPKSLNSKAFQPVLVRTSSSDRISHMASEERHRRSKSDTPQRAVHRRMGSGDLPPMAHRRMGSESAGSNRSRTLSTGSLRHHRQASNGSIASITSAVGSVVSNIAKSSMFGGVDEATGKVQMHFPYEAVRLVFVDRKEEALRKGHLYMDSKLSDFDDFEEYTRITNALEEGTQPQWESLEKANNVCGCECNHCNGCLGRQQLLKSPSYLLAVDSTIYKKVVGEIADAHSMPCGLFFCGHHEDVAHPSIAIAVLLVALLFLSMAYLSFAIEGA